MPYWNYNKIRNSFSPLKNIINIPSINFLVYKMFVEEKEFLKTITIDLKDIAYFDPSLIGWLALRAHASNKKINIILPQDNKLRFQFIQISPLLKEFIKTDFRPEKKYFVASKDFSPVIFINHSSYKYFFSEKIDFNNYICKITNSIETKLRLIKSDKNRQDELYRIVRESIYNSELELGSKIVLLYLTSLYRHFLLMRKFIDDALKKDNWHLRPKSLGIKGLNQSEEIKYEELIYKKLNSTLFLSPFMIILGNLILRNFTQYSLITNNNKNEYTKYKENIERKIELMLNFIFEYHTGIKELAKNIVEHSERAGFIVIRAYSKQSTEDLFEELKSLVKYTPKIPDNEGIISVYIIDYGKKGIITKAKETYETIQENCSKIGKEFSLKDEGYCDDFKKATEELKTLSDLFSNRLPHQKMRIAAGMGLPIFAKLIETNKGFCIVSTIDADSIYLPEDLLASSNIKKRVSLFTFGTSYLAVLPILKDKYLSPLKHLSISTHEYPKVKTVFKSIFPCKRISENNQLVLLKNKTILLNLSELYEDFLNFNLKKDIESNIKSLLRIKNKIEKIYNEYKDIDSNYIVGVMECIPSIDSPIELFHLLANIEYFTMVNAIVLSGEISENVIRELLLIFKTYSDSKKPIWSNDCYTLIYPVNISNNLKITPFIIGGENIETLIALNKKIAKYYDDYWIDFLKKNKYFEIDNRHEIDISLNSPLFINDLLIPFNILVKQNEHLTFFEYEVKNVLQQ